MWSHPFLCNGNGLDQSVTIELHMVDTGHAVVGVRLGEGTPMVYDIIIIRPGDMKDGMMPCAGGYVHILL